MRGALVVLLAAAPAAARDFSRGAAGTSAAQFLEMSVDARGAAMGGTGAAAASDASALYWNPARLAAVDAPSAVATRAEYLADTSLDYAAFAHPAGPGAIAASVQHFGAGSLNGTDAAGADAGAFSPYDLAATLGYGWNAGSNSLSFGAAGKFIQSRVVRTAQTGAADAGVSWRPDDALRLAFVASNIGGRLKFDAAREELPLSFRVAAAATPTPRLTLALEGIFSRDADPAAGVGAEWRTPEEADWTFAVRGGFNSRALEGGVPGLSGATLGFGLGRRGLKVDYALEPYGTLGLAHRFTLSWTPGSNGRPPRRWDREELP